MLEDIRNHDSTPTPEEREWIESNPFVAAVRVTVFLAVAVAIGGYMSLYLEPAPHTPTMATATK